MDGFEEGICEKALALGYEDCGIIPVAAMDGYGERLAERVEKVPESKFFYSRQKRLSDFRSAFPWSKSIVVCSTDYGRYRIPETTRNRIAKYYLVDGRIDEKSSERRRSLEFDAFLSGLGLRTANEPKFGLVGLRWAAMEAGIGIIRKNNFLYGKNGSWLGIEAWLTDREMELRRVDPPRACPEDCGLCRKACPTEALSSDYTLSPLRCVSFLTTFGGRNLPDEPLRREFRECVYGCELCQDACPFNKGKWMEEEDFPGLAELAEALSPDAILRMDEAFYRERVQPKFFYLGPDELWKWKVDVLNYMSNNYRADYAPLIETARSDPDARIATMARLVAGESRSHVETG